MIEENTTKLRDINEGVQNIILELLRNANLFKIKSQHLARYDALKEIYTYISPFEFENKDYLAEATNEIDDAVMQAGSKGFDMSQKLVIAQKRMEVRYLIDIYFQIIIQSLKELNLYLKIVKRQDDPDQQFSEETFTTNKSLLEEKKEKLGGLVTKTIIKYLTPRQINDVHARLLIDESMKI